MKERLLKQLSQILLGIAPKLVSKYCGVGLWGEPEIPESLKNLG